MVEPMFAKSSIDYHSVADLEAISVKVQQQKTAYLQQQQQRTAYLQQHVDRAQTANNVPPASWCFDNKALPLAAMSSAAMSRSENATVASSMVGLCRLTTRGIETTTRFSNFDCEKDDTTFQLEPLFSELEPLQHGCAPTPSLERLCPDAQQLFVEAPRSQ